MIRAWLATFVRRWHTNPDLCHTVDPIGAQATQKITWVPGGYVR
jgi:hypothetical protein